MINYLHEINLLFALGGLVLILVIGVLLYDYLKNDSQLYRRYVLPYVWYIILITTIGGVATTLLYSEYFGFAPCSLCWLQRVALYSQAFLALTAFRLKDAVFFPAYGITLSAFGLLVAVYHYIYQALPQDVHDAGLLPCLADGTASCSTKFMEVFGFVTFPFLSAVMFAFLITVYLNQRRVGRSEV